VAGRGGDGGGGDEPEAEIRIFGPAVKGTAADAALPAQLPDRGYMRVTVDGKAESALGGAGLEGECVGKAEVGCVFSHWKHPFTNFDSWRRF
jgi:hypothetical protein